MSPRRQDALLATALAAALLIQLALHETEGSATVNVVGGLLLTLPLAFRRTVPVAVVCVFVTTAILNEALGGALFTFPEAGAPDQDPPLFASIAAGMVAFYSLGAHAADRPATVGGVVGLAGLWATVLTSDQADFAAFVWSGGLVAATPWFAGRVARARRQRLAALEREQGQRTRIALSDERARIARELHDIVAHSVGVIVVQAEGARRVLARDPQRAGEALETIERTARAALGDMRSALGVLRDGNSASELTPQPGLGELDALIERSRAGGLEVGVTTEGDVRTLPQAVDLIAYRVIQEALTNTIKHAGRARSGVVLRYGDDALEVEVTDDGPGPPAEGVRPRGHGLIGMRERVAAHGGKLRIGAAPGGGLLVHAILPLTE